MSIICDHDLPLTSLHFHSLALLFMPTATMVVFHSPVQRQRRTPGFSTSPAPFQEEPDSIFNATPGPARARGGSAGASASAHGGSSHVKASGKSIDNKSIPGSAILQQRLQQSLMMVAESPSSKLNAPDPFRPRKQLRRSPPVAMRAFDHPLEVNKQSERIATSTIEEHEELLIDISIPQEFDAQPTAPSQKGKETQRNFEIAAKALFDTNRPDKGTKAHLEVEYARADFDNRTSSCARKSIPAKSACSFPNAPSIHFESSSPSLIARRRPPFCANATFNIKYFYRISSRWCIIR